MLTGNANRKQDGPPPREWNALTPNPSPIRWERGTANEGCDEVHGFKARTAGLGNSPPGPLLPRREERENTSRFSGISLGMVKGARTARPCGSRRSPTRGRGVRAPLRLGFEV